MRCCKITIIFTLVATCIFSNALAVDHAESIGRYLTVNNKPLSSQRDLLSQTVQIHFPQSIQTVGDAVNHLLRYSGYSLVAESQRSQALKNTLQKPLPLVDREFGPIALRDALTTLIGSAFVLVEDSLNREVNFRLKPNFSTKLYRGALR